MKRYLLFVLAVMLFACSNNDSTFVKTKSYEMGEYKVDIPETLKPDSRNAPYCSSWKDDHNFLFIERGKHVSYRYMMEKSDEVAKEYKRMGFNVSDVSRDEESACFKIQTDSFIGESCYVLTNNEGVDFLVLYNGANADMEQTKAIANSIKLRIEEAQPIGANPVFENELYKIEYPVGWKFLTNPDGESDIYIGEEDELFGVSIMHFDAGYSLEYIVDNEKATWQQLGVLSKYTKSRVAGEEAYKCVAIGNINGIQIKNISYSFKHKGIYYNIRFGNDPNLMDENSNVIEEIVKSFQFK